MLQLGTVVQSRLGFSLMAESMSGGPIAMFREKTGANGTREVGMGTGLESEPGIREEKCGIVSLIHGVKLVPLSQLDPWSKA